jgi:anthranilate synthase/phosphoribosyltransferase
MVLLVDNYDSFSYNVYQFVGALAQDVKVIRNDEIRPEEVADLNPTHIILSPGPGRPADAGICEDVIRMYAGKIPILGICLGHQAICEVFGATVTYAKQLMHGKQSIAALDNGSVLFAGMKHQTTVGRYHSLAADPETLPECLKVVAQTDDGEIMAVEHREYPVYGVQFHPESVLTPEGMTILENFITGGKARKESKESKKMAIYEAIRKLTAGEDIGYQMSKDVMNEIMSGEASDVAKASYLTALSMKGETGEEISGSAEAMRDHAVRMNVSEETLEIVGTGGDCYGSFNISTTSSIVIAASGVPVTKHGNRAASSKSGAADCLEALGVNIQIDPKKNEEVFKRANICFLFAQKYHTAMRYVGPIRKELGVRTVFNLLGPLTNPAFATLQILGVYSEDLVEPMAKVLTDIGVRRGMVVYGMEKIDEISSCGPTKVCEFEGNEFKTYEITPEQFGLTRGERGQLVGGTPEDNAKITLAILQGEQGPRRDAVLMNAGAGLYIAGKAQTMEEGVKMAAELIDSGKAYEKLQQFIRETNAE